MPITPSPAVLRACDVLEHLAAHPGEAFSVSELAREVGIPRATCDAVLLALAERAYVDRRDPDLRYALGPAAIAVGDAARASGSLFDRIAPVVDALGRETGTCAALAGLAGGALRVERVFDHGPAFGVRTRVGESVLLGAPFGAVFVAWESASAIARWLDAASARLTDDDRHRYEDALAAVRERGYSIAVSNARADLSDLQTAVRDAAIREVAQSEYLPVALEPGAAQRVNQMSAPVFDRMARVTAQVMVLGPTYDLTVAEIDALAARLLAAARAATERIGGVEPDPAERTRRVAS
ncbi:MAG: helix-turn-helix domain-containing protein [Acidimicrobiia bacterium]|jgi:DNA-binding IclR family transcriptional regulator